MGPNKKSPYLNRAGGFFMDSITPSVECNLHIRACCYEYLIGIVDKHS